MKLASIKSTKATPPEKKKRAEPWGLRKCRKCGTTIPPLPKEEAGKRKTRGRIFTNYFEGARKFLCDEDVEEFICEYFK